MIKFLLPLFFVVQQSFTDQNVNRYCTDLTPQNDIEVDTVREKKFKNFLYSFILIQSKLIN